MWAEDWGGQVYPSQNAGSLDWGDHEAGDQWSDLSDRYQME